MQRMPAQPKVELMMPAAARIERGVLKHEAVVLGLGLSLDTLAVSGSDRVHVPTDVGGADEAHATHPRVGQQQLSLGAAAGDDVDDALRAARLPGAVRTNGRSRWAPCWRP